MKVFATIILLTAATWVACNTSSSAQGEIVGRTPNLEATVEVLVEEKLKEILTATPYPLRATPTLTPVPPKATPTPGPRYFPTYFDYESGILAISPVDTPQFLLDALLRDSEYEKRAAAYVLGSCLDGHILTREGFRLYLLGKGQDTPGNKAIEDGLSDVIELASMDDECMRPFTYPITENDWTLAFGLVEMPSSPLFSPFQGAAVRARRRYARSWEYGESKDMPFILWLCEIMC